MDVVGITHTLAAASALLLGPSVFVRKKGTALHKKLGYGYVFSMLVLNATALMIYDLFQGWGIFHYLSALSLLTLLSGFVPAYLKRPANWIEWHYMGMTWSYVGLTAAAVAETLTRTPLYWPAITEIIPGHFFWNAVGVGTFVVCGAGWYLINKRKLGYPGRNPA
ncbi:MAG: DUF2306 domain-containing protein [Gammaproteobacteria bacterium]|nr:DUF2306 domain-containing protein [Gammaproteobacteria bacterium]